MNTENSLPSLAAQMDEVLRLWAGAQAPDHDFSQHRVGVITKPLQLKQGLFFAPGELVLFRPAAVLAPEGVTVTRPASVWSFDLKQEVLVPAVFLAAQAPAAPLPAEAESDEELKPAA
jgi:hypothetical protein